MAVLGTAAGYMTGSLISIQDAEASLRSYADRLMSRSDYASQEARAMLAAMRQTGSPYCSHQELRHFGLLLFGSQYLRDAGHMRLGKIDCSLILGPLDPPVEVPEPDFEQPDGTRVYSELPLFQAAGLPAVTLQMADAYVTLSPNLMTSVNVPEYRYSFAVVHSVGRSPGPLFGQKWALPPEVQAAEGEGSRAGILYATRCSARFFNCVTTYSPISEVLRTEQRRSIEGALVGGFAGIGVAFSFFLLAERRNRMDRQLRRALRKNALDVEYQPVVDLQNGQTIGLEALARWRDENGNAVSPEVFIPLAEKMGMADAVTRIVLLRILEDMGDVLKERREFRVSFNVSAGELTGSQFLNFLHEELRMRGIPPQSLAVEITEGSTANHAELGMAIRQLREYGLRVYLDDFGTGYSSLSYLNELNVDIVKIDKSFTRAIGTHSVTASILPQILEMTKKLNLLAIVEGVETEEQARYLSAFNRPMLVQGWHFGRPMPEWLLKERLSNEQRTASVP